jgi:hypothetical protein
MGEQEQVVGREAKAVTALVLEESESEDGRDGAREGGAGAASARAVLVGGVLAVLALDGRRGDGLHWGGAWRVGGGAAGGRRVPARGPDAATRAALCEWLGDGARVAAAGAVWIEAAGEEVPVFAIAAGARVALLWLSARRGLRGLCRAQVEARAAATRISVDASQGALLVRAVDDSRAWKLPLGDEPVGEAGGRSSGMAAHPLGPLRIFEPEAGKPAGVDCAVATRTHEGCAWFACGADNSISYWAAPAGTELAELHERAPEWRRVLAARCVGLCCAPLSGAADLVFASALDSRGRAHVFSSDPRVLEARAEGLPDCVDQQLSGDLLGTGAAQLLSLRVSPGHRPGQLQTRLYVHDGQALLAVVELTTFSQLDSEATLTAVEAPAAGATTPAALAPPPASAQRAAVAAALASRAERARAELEAQRAALEAQRQLVSILRAQLQMGGLACRCSAGTALSAWARSAGLVSFFDDPSETIGAQVADVNDYTKSAAWTCTCRPPSPVQAEVLNAKVAASAGVVVAVVRVRNVSAAPLPAHHVYASLWSATLPLESECSRAAGDLLPGQELAPGHAVELVILARLGADPLRLGVSSLLLRPAVFFSPTEPPLLLPPLSIPVDTLSGARPPAEPSPVTVQASSLSDIDALLANRLPPPWSVTVELRRASGSAGAVELEELAQALGHELRRRLAASPWFASLGPLGPRVSIVDRTTGNQPAAQSAAATVHCTAWDEPGLLATLAFLRDAAGDGVALIPRLQPGPWRELCLALCRSVEEELDLVRELAQDEQPRGDARQDLALLERQADTDLYFARLVGAVELLYGPLSASEL